jgi:hypothetical protein
MERIHKLYLDLLFYDPKGWADGILWIIFVMISSIVFMLLLGAILRVWGRVFPKSGDVEESNRPPRRLCLCIHEHDDCEPHKHHPSMHGT